jgi:hypothetical protein
MIGNYRYIPTSLKMSFSPELRRYLSANLRPERNDLKSVTARRRWSMHNATPAKALFDIQYFLREAMNQLNASARAVSYESVEETEERSEYLRDLPIFLDYRCLPVCDAENQFPELRGFGYAYWKCRNQYTRSIQASDRKLRGLEVDWLSQHEVEQKRLQLYLEAAARIRQDLQPVLEESLQRVNDLIY